MRDIFTNKFTEQVSFTHDYLVPEISAYFHSNEKQIQDRAKKIIESAKQYNSYNAEEKLNNKNCDWIIANDVSNKEIGFDSDFNEVTIHYKDKDIKKEKLAYKKKSEISDEIVDRIIDQLN